jgi:molecular chaperone DnaK
MSDAYVPSDGLPEQAADGGNEHPVVRDRRRIDPATGEVRQPAEATQPTGAPSEPEGSEREEAEKHADEDRKRREVAEVRNQAEQLVYSTVKFLADNADKVPAESKTEVETAISDLKAALASESTSTDELKRKTEAVSQASQKVGQAMYAASEAQGASDGAADASAPGGTTADDDVVDAEVVDEDDAGPKAS